MSQIEKVPASGPVTEQEYNSLVNPNKISITEDEVLNDPRFKQIRENMSPEELESYKKIGDYMYSEEKIKMMQEPTEETAKDAAAYIVASINSGLHISYLADCEKHMLEVMYGDTWYETFGFTKDDLNEVVTY